MPDISGLTHTVNCNMSPGVKEAYFFKTTEVDGDPTTDGTSKEITDIAMLSTKQGYKVEFDDTEANYTTTQVGGFTNRAVSVLTFSILKLDAATREIVQGWDDAACLGCIVKLYNGEAVCLGYDYDSRVSPVTFKPVPKVKGAGTAMSGLPTDTGDTATAKRTRIYQWTSNNEPAQVASTFDYDTFTTPAE